MEADIRKNDFDVTNHVQVSSPTAVQKAVADIFARMPCYKGTAPDDLTLLFNDFHQMFTGELEGYVGCETVYHDMQHSLDVTLAMARLLGGHEQTASSSDAFGKELCLVGLTMALFHDAGYIRRSDRNELGHGAEYTLQHVARSAEIIGVYLEKIGLSQHAKLAMTVVHYTDPRQDINALNVTDPKWHRLGQLLGTADYMAQMSDRCYLEKARDRLYAEFVLGGVALVDINDGDPQVVFKDGEDLLRKTPAFFEHVTETRLNRDFNRAYRYFKHFFGGNNPYVDAINKNIEFLNLYLEKNELPDLKRNPPCFTYDDDALSDTQTLVAERIRKYLDSKSAD